jgi:predicted DsbA family dithiol-disulfide isomerase
MSPQVPTMNQASPVQLDVFVDFICPWCYLAHGVVQQLRGKRAVRVQWSPFPLHPDTPAEGMLLSDLFRGANVDAMHQRLYAIMDELKLPYSKSRDRLYNTRKAQELALWAQEQDGGEALVGELFRAYFVDNRNLADDAVLLDAVAQAGLDVEAARLVLASRSQSTQVDAAWERARQLRLNGVPAFVGGGYQFSGYQPLVEMERFLDFVQSKA